MLRGVIFDMDGVIFDSHPIHKMAWKQFLDHLGRSVTDEELDFVLDGRKREDIIRHFLGEMSLEEIRVHGFRKDALFHEVAEQVKPVAGVLEFLDQLEDAEIPKAIATCASDNRARSMLARSGLAARFDAIVTGCEVPNGKPNPAIFELAVHRLGVGKQGVIVVEDAVAGVQAAKSAGMKCLAVASYNRSEELLKAGADMVVTDFCGLDLNQVRACFVPTCIP